VPWATPHKLRHNLAALMASNGYSPGSDRRTSWPADGGLLALRTYFAFNLTATEEPWIVPKVATQCAAPHPPLQRQPAVSSGAGAVCSRLNAVVRA
jgi:hypothetical protein